MRKKLKPEDKKVKLTITVDPKLAEVVTQTKSNISKYVEHLIYVDLTNNNMIDAKNLF